MTPDTFRAYLDAIGWSLRGLADRLDCDPRMVRRWASGEASLPPAIGHWLYRLRVAHEALPPPEDWRRR